MMGENMSRSFSRLLFALLLIGCLAQPASARWIPQSPTISGISLDWASHTQHADESDNFHMTWHPNGSLFAPWGDGWGFATTRTRPKAAFGVAEIRGGPTALDAIDVFVGHRHGGKVETWDGKSWGIVAVNTDLYMWMSPGSPRSIMFREARLAKSTDNGRSWTRARWAFGPGDKIILPSFMQLGAGYTSEQLDREITDYLYSFYPRLTQYGKPSQKPGIIDIMRVPKSRPMDRGAYQFLIGFDRDGDPIWSSSTAGRQPVLQKAFVSWAPPSVSYNPYRKRFLMAMAHVTTASAVSKGLAVYEAKKPWGPWFKVVETDLFAHGTCFFFQFPTKWMDEDGQSMWMAFTGTDKRGGREWDSLNLMKVRLQLK
jgi:hypothetical protein